MPKGKKIVVAEKEKQTTLISKSVEKLRGCVSFEFSKGYKQELSDAIFEHYQKKRAELEREQTAL